MLSDQQKLDFWERGCIFPIAALSVEQAGKYRSDLETFESSRGGPHKATIPHKSYLVFAWLAELIRSPGILDAVEDILGPDLLCWNANFFIKNPTSPMHVTWHQDATYFGLNKPDVVTAWVALTDSTESNGAMEFVPGSHKKDQLPHRDTFAADNLLSRGQEIVVTVDESLRQVVTLHPGEISLHHGRLVHKSPPNLSHSRRLGFAIRYIATNTIQTLGRDSATLVRGEDRYGHFDPEPQPRWDFDPEVLEYHKQMMTRSGELLYRNPGPAGGAM